jgi:hypothetical protein
MNACQLRLSKAQRSVTAHQLSTAQLCRQATYPDEEHVESLKDGQTVSRAPWLAQDVVHDDVVARSGHARGRPMEAGTRVVQNVREAILAQVEGALLGSHGVEVVNRHVEVGLFQQSE